MSTRPVSAWLLAALAALAVAGSAPRARAQAPTDPAAFADQIFAAVNQQRANAGVPPLARDPRLDQAARDFSQYMVDAGFFDHVGPNGVQPDQRMDNAGFQPIQDWGENIAAGYTDVGSVVDAWMNSPGHRENILDPAFVDAGVGVAVRADGTPFITQDFGTLASAPPPQPPSAPQRFRCKAQKGLQMLLTWQDPAHDADGFVLERAGPGGTSVLIGPALANQAGAASFVDTGLAPKTTYLYHLHAVNGAGSSPTVQATGKTKKR